MQTLLPHQPLPWARLMIAVGACLAVGWLGSIVTMPAVSSWYQTIDKPAFTPPDWVFGPVWTTLYIMMGVSAALVWNQWGRHPRVPWALAVFTLQLAVNLAWSVLFFGEHRLFAGFVDIVFLWNLILFTIVVFWSIHRLAALLLLPYWAWVSFAAVLNYWIWQLNP